MTRNNHITRNFILLLVIRIELILTKNNSHVLLNNNYNIDVNQFYQYLNLNTKTDSERRRSVKMSICITKYIS